MSSKPGEIGFDWYPNLPKKPKTIPTDEVIIRICKSIHDLDLTLLEMSFAVKEKGAGVERLKKYEDAVTDIQIMYKAMLNMIQEYEKLWHRENKLFHVNQDLLREIETLKKIDSL